MKKSGQITPSDGAAVVSSRRRRLNRVVDSR